LLYDNAKLHVALRTQNHFYCNLKWEGRLHATYSPRLGAFGLSLIPLDAVFFNWTAFEIYKYEVQKWINIFIVFNIFFAKKSEIYPRDNKK